MMMTILISCTVGALLGLRYNVFILVPAMAIAAVIAAASCMVHGEGVSMTLLITISAIWALQLGYLGGVGARLLWKPLTPDRVTGRMSAGGAG